MYICVPVLDIYVHMCSSSVYIHCQCARCLQAPVHKCVHMRVICVYIYVDTYTFICVYICVSSQGFAQCLAPTAIGREHILQRTHSIENTFLGISECTRFCIVSNSNR